jgi:hypothetical protein
MIIFVTYDFWFPRYVISLTTSCGLFLGNLLLFNPVINFSALMKPEGLLSWEQNPYPEYSQQLNTLFL